MSVSNTSSAETVLSRRFGYCPRASQTRRGAEAPRLRMPVSLSVKGPPVKRVRFCFRTVGWVVGQHARVGPQAGSRWSARSEARTNDLGVGEDRRMLGVDPALVSAHRRRLPMAAVVGMGCAASLCLIWVLEPVLNAGAARRRDGRWDEPGGVARLLVLSGTTTVTADDRRLSGASREHQLIETRARTAHRDQAALASMGASIGVQAWSPRAPRL